MLFQGGQGCKHQDARNIEEIKNQGGCPVDIRPKEMAQVVTIKTLRHDSEPEHVDPEKYRQCEEINIDELHHTPPCVLLDESFLYHDGTI
jgi:hypothetical protein